MLLASKDIIAHTKVWQRRHGGNLYNMYPISLSSQKGFQEKMDQIPLYCKKAAELHKIASGLSHIHAGEVPQCNMMHWEFAGDVDQVEKAALEVAKEHKILILNKLWVRDFNPTPVTEISVGESLLNADMNQVIAALDLFNSKLASVS